MPGNDRRWALEEPRAEAHEAAAQVPTEGEAQPEPPVEPTPTSEGAAEGAEAPEPAELSSAGSLSAPAVQAPPTVPAPENRKDGQQPALSAAGAPAPLAKPPTGPLRVPRGEGLEPIVVPRNERLLYKVYVSLGWLGQPSVGRVQLTSNVEPFRASALTRDAPAEARGERGVLVARAWGNYSFYELDETITSLLLPQAWPAVIHRTTQTGTENRRRELRMGTDPELGPRAWYRADRHCSGCADRAHFIKPTWAWQDEHHCKKCKRAEHRVWRQPTERDVPPGTVDMLSAVLLARAMIAEGRQELKFLLLDKTELWEVSVQRGAESEIEVPAGKFRATQVMLRTTVPPGEEDREGDFEGLFGIQGDISIWFESATGLPVQISGKVPAGPMRLAVSINLAEL